MAVGLFDCFVCVLGNLMSSIVVSSFVYKSFFRSIDELEFDEEFLPSAAKKCCGRPIIIVFF